MKWRVILRPRAEADLRKAQSWYEARQAGLGAAWVDELRRAITVLEQRPASYGDYYRGFRRLLTQRFPYKLFYRIEGDVVVVFRILHASRDHRSNLNE